MSEPIRMLQTLDSNSKISLIILKGNLPYVLKNSCLCLQSILLRERQKERLKNFGWTYRLEAITPIGVVLGWGCPQSIYPGVQLS